jgi:hypothetical protein
MTLFDLEIMTSFVQPVGASATASASKDALTLRSNTVSRISLQDRSEPDLKTMVLALTPRICEAPIADVDLLEQCGRIVLVAVTPTALPDPIIPVPIANLPNRFWKVYAGFFRKMQRFHTFGNSATLWGSRVERCWHLIDEMLSLTRDTLTGAEQAYLDAQLKAALAGDQAR